MSYEMLKAPELSLLAPCNVGVCHLPLFHVIWYKYTKWADDDNNGPWMVVLASLMMLHACYTTFASGKVGHKR